MKLTKRQWEILTIMLRDDEELVYENGHGGYLGTSRVAARTVFALLRLMALHGYPASQAVERYTISETGRQLLKEAR